MFSKPVRQPKYFSFFYMGVPASLTGKPYRNAVRLLQVRYRSAASFLQTEQVCPILRKPAAHPKIFPAKNHASVSPVAALRLAHPSRKRLYLTHEHRIFNFHNKSRPNLYTKTGCCFRNPCSLSGRISKRRHHQD